MSRFQNSLTDRVLDRDGIRCVADQYRGEALSRMLALDCGNGPHSLETLSAATNVTATGGGLDYTPILVSVLLAVLILVIGYLVAFTFRSSIKVIMIMMLILTMILCYSRPG